MAGGRHAANDGSFGRSIALAAGRAALLVGAAVVLGIVLLQATDNSPKKASTASATSSTTTTSRSTRAAVPSTTVTTSPGERKPAQIKVVVMNAAGKQGVARAVSDRLAKSGYQMQTPGTLLQHNTATVVYCKSGFEKEGNTLAATVGSGATAKPLPDPNPYPGTSSADCVVVLGANGPSA